MGGIGARMGSPKQLLLLHGRSLAARVADVLAGHASPVVVLGAGALPRDLPSLPAIPDVPGIRGPVAGLVAALRWLPGATWLFCPCDHPSLSGEALVWLLAQRRPGVWAVLPRSRPDQLEPLLALYEPEALTLIEDATAQGNAPRSLAGHPHVASPLVPPALRPAWVDVNTREDAAALGLVRPDDG